MKLIPTGNKRTEYEYPEDIRNDNGTEKTQLIPSYHDIAKKAREAKKK